jgi:hypothetical protein
MKQQKKSFKVGDKVEFTDEFGKKQISHVTSLDAYGVKGMLGIEGSYGCYVRKISEVKKHGT